MNLSEITCRVKLDVIVPVGEYIDFTPPKTRQDDARVAPWRIKEARARVLSGGLVEYEGKQYRLRSLTAKLMSLKSADCLTRYRAAEVWSYEGYSIDQLESEFKLDVLQELAA